MATKKFYTEGPIYDDDLAKVLKAESMQISVDCLRNVVLVEGNPQIGKTTFLEDIIIRTTPDAGHEYLYISVDKLIGDDEELSIQHEEIIKANKILEDRTIYWEDKPSENEVLDLKKNYVTKIIGMIKNEILDQISTDYSLDREELGKLMGNDRFFINSKLPKLLRSKMQLKGSIYLFLDDTESLKGSFKEFSHNLYQFSNSQAFRCIVIHSKIDDQDVSKSHIVRYKLQPLNQTQTMDLINQGTKGVLEVSDAAYLEIQEQTGGHPYLVQKMGQKLVKDYQNRHVISEDIKNVGRSMTLEYDRHLEALSSLLKDHLGQKLKDCVSQIMDTPRNFKKKHEINPIFEELGITKKGDHNHEYTNKIYRTYFNQMVK